MLIYLTMNGVTKFWNLRLEPISTIQDSGKLYSSEVFGNSQDNREDLDAIFWKTFQWKLALIANDSNVAWLILDWYFQHEDRLLNVLFLDLFPKKRMDHGS